MGDHSHFMNLFRFASRFHYNFRKCVGRRGRNQSFHILNSRFELWIQILAIRFNVKPSVMDVWEDEVILTLGVENTDLSFWKIWFEIYSNNQVHLNHMLVISPFLFHLFSDFIFSNLNWLFFLNPYWFNPKLHYWTNKTFLNFLPQRNLFKYPIP